MATPKFLVFIATSIDGYIARSDGSVDWLGIVHKNNEDYGYQEFFLSIDTVILGRNTYDTVLGFEDWPYAKKRCIVLTHTPPTPRHQEEFFSGDVRQLAEKLEKEKAYNVYVDGGQVVQQFLSAGLVAELTISVVPILLGSGIRLFAEGGREVQPSKMRARSFPTGLVQVRYDLRPTEEA